jgi:hypothetical protein
VATLAVLTLFMAAAMSGCRTADARPTPSPTSVPATGTPLVPPAFPFIFAGDYFVGGQPGPAGQKIFARVGGTRSSVAETFDGTYRNVIIGPSAPEDQRGLVSFYLGDPDGTPVKADETYEFTLVAQPLNVQLDLHFPVLP